MAAPSELQLLGYTTGFRRTWVLFVAPILMFIVVALVNAQRTPIEYRATARVLVVQSEAARTVQGGSNADRRSRSLHNEANLATGDVVSELVAERLSGTTTVSEKSWVSVDSESDVLGFTAVSDNPLDAALGANVWASTYVEVKQLDTERSIDITIDQLKSRLSDLRSERTRLQVNVRLLENQLAAATDQDERDLIQQSLDKEVASVEQERKAVDVKIRVNIETIAQLQQSRGLVGEGSAVIIQEAATPRQSVNVPPFGALLAAVVAGVCSGVGLLLLVPKAATDLTFVEEARSQGLTILGEIRFESRWRKAFRRSSEASSGSLLNGDSIRQVRANLLNLGVGSDLTSVLVTSPRGGDGKTTVAVELSLAFAQIEKEVVLADANFHKPKIDSIFNLDREPGVLDVLKSETESVFDVATKPYGYLDNFSVVASGVSIGDVAMLLSESRLSRIFEELQQEAEVVVVDSAPVYPVADALTLCPHVDGVVVVARAESGRFGELMSARAAIKQAGGNVLGFVVADT